MSVVDTFQYIVDKDCNPVMVRLQWDENKLKAYVCSTKSFKVRHESRYYSDPEFIFRQIAKLFLAYLTNEHLKAF